MARSDLQIHFFKIRKFHINIQFIPCLEELEALISLGLCFLTQFKESFSVTIGLVQIPVLLYWVAHLEILIQIPHRALALVII